MFSFDIKKNSRSFEKNEKRSQGRPVRAGTNGGVTLLGLAGAALGGIVVGLSFWAWGPAAAGAAAVASAASSSSSSLLSRNALSSFGPAAASAARLSWALVPLALLSGFLGSLLDSFLGATLQFSGYDRKQQKMISTSEVLRALEERRKNDGAPNGSDDEDSPGDIVAISGIPLLSNTAVNVLSSAGVALGGALVAARWLAALILPL